MKQEHQQERVGSNNARHKGWLDSKGGRLFLAALGLAMALTAAGCATPFKELSPQEQILEQIKELLEPGNLSDSETVSKILNVKFRKRTMNNSIIYIMSESDFRFESVDYEPNVTGFKVKNRIKIRLNNYRLMPVGSCSLR